jgi:hypothetical protein
MSGRRESAILTVSRFELVPSRLQPLYRKRRKIARLSTIEKFCLSHVISFDIQREL